MENLVVNTTIQSSNDTPFKSSEVVAFDYQNDVWVVAEEISDKTFDINFKERFNTESQWQISVAKAAIYDRCIEFEGKLKSKNTVQTVRGFVSILTSLLDNCNRYYEDKLLSEYTEYDLLKIAAYYRDEEKLKAFGSVQAASNIITALWQLRLSNHLTEIDYLPSCKLPERWAELAVKHFAPEGFNLTEWVHGGTYDIVPFEVSLAVLTYCIEIIRSDELKYLLAWCEILRKHAGTESYIRQRAANKMLSNFGGEYHSKAIVAKRYDTEYFECLQQYFPNAVTHADLPLKEIPFTYHQDDSVLSDNHIRKLTQFYRNACYIAFLILTGVRDSEARAMRFDAIKKDGSRLIHYTPIEKTHHGIETGRPIGKGLIEEIVDVMQKLGSSDYCEEERPLFFDVTQSALKLQNNYNYTMNLSGNHQIHEFYSRFLQDHGPEMERICPKVTAHAFRHSWAEFAMRRFDGHIIPLIANHFRHEAGQFMNFTQEYTNAKLSEGEYKEIGNRFIYDIIDRYVVGADDIYGAMGAFMKSLVNDLNLVAIEDDQERKLMIKTVWDENAGNRVVHVTAYGICVVNMDAPEQANCTDAYGVPKTDEATPDMCNGCPNHCVLKAHLEENKRLTQAYALQAKQMKDEPILYSLFGKAAEREHRTMQAALQKMEA